MIVYSFYSIRTNVTNLHCEDSVGIYTEQNGKKAYIWRSDDERLVRTVWVRVTDYLKEHTDGIAVPDNLALRLDDIVLTSMEMLYNSCDEDDT